MYPFYNIKKIILVLSYLNKQALNDTYTVHLKCGNNLIWLLINFKLCYFMLLGNMILYPILGALNKLS